MFNMLVAKPGEEPYIKDAARGMTEIGEIVAGPLECVKLGDDFVLYCNKEGTERDLPLNPHFSQGIVKGPCVIVKTDETGDPSKLGTEDIRLVRKTYLRDDTEGAFKTTGGDEA